MQGTDTDEYYKQVTDTRFMACDVIEELRNDGFTNEALIGGLLGAAIYASDDDRALFLSALERFMGSYNYRISVKPRSRNRSSLKQSAD